MNTSSQKWRGTLVLVAVFVAGALAGVAVDRVRASEEPARRLSLQMSSVFDRLQLTPHQRHAVDSILNASTPRTEAVMQEMAPKLNAIVDSVNSDLRLLLTPPQQAVFDSLQRGSRRLLLKQRVGDRVDTVYRR